MRAESYSKLNDSFAIDKRDTMNQNMQLNMDTWKTICQTPSSEAKSKCLMIPTVRETLDFLNGLMNDQNDEIFEILVTGSLHFVGTVLKGLDYTINKSN